MKAHATRAASLRPLEGVGRWCKFAAASATVAWSASLSPGAPPSDGEVRPSSEFDLASAHVVPPEILAGWRKLSERLQSVSGSGSWSCQSRTQDGQRRFIQWDVHFWIAPDAVKFQVDTRDYFGAWTSRKVYVVNPDYAFIATQKRLGEPFALEALLPAGMSTDQVAGDFVFRTIFTSIRCAMVTECDHRELSELAVSPGFRLLSLENRQTGGGGDEKTLVTFEFAPTGRAANQSASPRRVTAELAPADNWRLCRTWSSFDGVTSDMEVVYPSDAETRAGRPPLPRRMQSRMVDSQGDIYWLVELSESTSQSPSPAEFRLPSIGLPEAAVGTAFWPWGLAGGVLILGGAAVRRLRFARADAQSQPALNHT